ncbi:MAG: DNA-processing protein DprA, partial [Candidatus Rokubacteria bacterium]|nr:DNA-processing protein DprA [Candidatus Rokubacteria bacterium]
MMTTTRIYAETLSDARHRASAWREEIARAAAGPSVRVVSPGTASFPGLLGEIPDPPACLHVWGHILAEDALAVAVVGSRQATPYGIEVAERLGFDLATRGVTVVSGLARG